MTLALEITPSVETQILTIAVSPGAKCGPATTNVLGVSSKGLTSTTGAGAGGCGGGRGRKFQLQAATAPMHVANTTTLLTDASRQSAVRGSTDVPRG